MKAGGFWRQVARVSVAVLLLLSTAAASEEETEQESIKSYAVPDAPALTFLDATPSEITQPSSGQEFLMQVLSGFGRSGQVQQGLAVNSDLWYLLGKNWGGSITMQQYQESFFWRAWANTALSLGTVKAQGEGVVDGDTDFSLGLRTVLYDESDFLRSKELRKVFAETLQECLPGPETSAADARKCTNEKLEERLKSPTLVAAKKDAAKDWNATRVSLAVASGLRFRQSRLADSEWIGTSAWLNGSSGIGSRIQLLGYARYDFRNVTGSNVLRAGGRVSLGSDTVNGFAEALVNHDFNAETDATTGRWALGISYGLARGLWLTGSLGSTFETSRDPLAVLATLKYSLSSVPQLDPTK